MTATVLLMSATETHQLCAPWNHTQPRHGSCRQEIRHWSPVYIVCHRCGSGNTRRRRRKNVCDKVGKGGERRRVEKWCQDLGGVGCQRECFASDYNISWQFGIVL